LKFDQNAKIDLLYPQEIGAITNLYQSVVDMHYDEKSQLLFALLSKNRILSKIEEVLSLFTLKQTKEPNGCLKIYKLEQKPKSFEFKLLAEKNYRECVHTRN